MRGHLLILTFGMAILFHGASSSRLKIGSSSALNSRERFRNIRQIAERIGATNYEEFSASLSDSEELSVAPESSEYFSTRKQRASNNQQKDTSTELNSSESNRSTDSENYQGVVGRPGIDFPVLTHIPRTKFTCKSLKTGYYADLDTDCQVFHICDNGRKISFLCPNGTIFRQSDLICDWWFKVDCEKSPTLYEETADQLAFDQQQRKNARKVDNEKSTTTNNNNSEDSSRSIRKLNNHSGENNLNKNKNNANLKQNVLSQNSQSTFTNQQIKQNPNPRNRNTGSLRNSSNQQSSNEQRERLEVNEQNYNFRRFNGRQSFKTTTSSAQVLNNTKSDQTHSNGMNSRKSEIPNTFQNTKETVNTNKQAFKTQQSFLDINENYNSTQYTNNKEKNENIKAVRNQGSYSRFENISNRRQPSFKKENSQDSLETHKNRTPSSRRINIKNISKEFENTDSQLTEKKGLQRNRSQERTFDNNTNSSQETQQPAETASFASNQFNNFERFYQQNRLNNRNTTPKNNIYKYTTDFLRHDVFSTGKTKSLKDTSASTAHISTTTTDVFKTLSSLQKINPSTVSPREAKSSDSILMQTRTDSPLPTASIYTTRPQPYQITNSYSTVKQSPEPTVSSFIQKIVTPSYTKTETSSVKPETSTLKNIENTTSYDVKGHFVTYTYPSNSNQQIEKHTTQSPFSTRKNINSNNNQDILKVRSVSTKSSNKNIAEGPAKDIFDFRLGKSVTDKEYTSDSTTVSILDSSLSTLSTVYLPPRIESRYSRVSQTPPTVLPSKESSSTTASSYKYDEPYFYPRGDKKFDPTIFSPDRFSADDIITTQKSPKYPQSVTKYSPTVPTVTPKTPTQSTINKIDSFTETNFVTTPTPRISENAMRMIYTLENLEGKFDVRKGKEINVSTNTNSENSLRPPRPGLRVPPSSSPDTLHSLAMYFASAVDDIIQNNTTTRFATNDIGTSSPAPHEESTSTDEDISDHETSLLTESIMNQYKELFNAATTDMSDMDVNIMASSVEIEDKINKELSNNDLESQQSRGPVSKDSTNGTSIRHLARVFTHALSEYLKDPDTFKRVLTEIRPTEPPSTQFITTVYPTTDFSTTLFTDHPSITKEEDEVLDFSDVVKTTPRKTDVYTTPYAPVESSPVYSTTEIPSLSARFESTTSKAFAIFTKIQETNARNLINPLAARLNEELGGNVDTNFSESSENNSQESSNRNSHENNYFPVLVNGERKMYNASTPSPYGLGVKPQNSTPIGINNYKQNSKPETSIYGDIQTTTQSILRLRPSTSLVPPKFDDPTSRNDIDKISADLINYFVPEDLNNLAVIRVNEEIITQQQLQEGKKLFNQTKNEEQLQAEYTQSFVSRNNNNIARNPKKIENNKQTLKNTITSIDLLSAIVTTENPSTESFKSLVTTDFNKDETSTVSTETTTYEITSTSDPEISTRQTFFDLFFSQGRTTDRSFESTTNDKNSIPLNHWTRSPVVTQFLRSSVGVDAETINRELGEIRNRFSDLSNSNLKENVTDFTSTTTEDGRFDTDISTESPKMTSTESATENTRTSTTNSYQSTTEQSSPVYFPMTEKNLHIYTTSTEFSTPAYSTTTEPNIFTNKRTELNFVPQSTTTESSTSLFTVTEENISASSTTTDANTSSFTTEPSTVTYTSTTDSNSLLLTSTTEINNLNYTSTTESNDLIFTSTLEPNTSETIELAETKSRFGSRETGKSLSYQSEPQQFVIPFPDYLNSTEIQIKSAKEIFGNLNSSSQGLLMDKMKHADSNKSVRRLVLLLINTCDLNHNKTIEDARNSILNALLNTPIEENDVISNYKPGLSTDYEVSTTTATPTTTTTLSTSTVLETVNEYPTTTTQVPEIIYRNNEIKKIVSEKVENFRQSKSIASETSQSSHHNRPENTNSEKLIETETDSDARALELLKSLYSLAAKWGKK